MTLFAIVLGVHFIGVVAFVVIFLVSERAYLRIAASSMAAEHRRTPFSPGERDAARLDVELPVMQVGLAHLTQLPVPLHDASHSLVSLGSLIELKTRSAPPP